MDSEHTVDDVFISYRRSEKGGSTPALYWALHDSGIRCFYDKVSIRVGAMWDDEIDRALANCKVMLLVIEDNFFSSLDSHYQQRIRDPGDVFASEIRRGLERAKNKKMTMIPVVIGGKMPDEKSLPEALKQLAFVQGEVDLDVNVPTDIGRVVARIRAVLGPDHTTDGGEINGGDGTARPFVNAVASSPDPVRSGPEPTMRFSGTGVIGILDSTHGLEVLRLIGNHITCGHSVGVPRLQRKLPFSPTCSSLSSDGTLFVVADEHQVLAIDINSERLDFGGPAPRIGDGSVLCCWYSRGKVNLTVSTGEGDVQWRFDSSRSSLVRVSMWAGETRKASMCEVPAEETGFAAIDINGELDLPPFVASRVGEISRRGWLSLDCGYGPPGKNSKSGTIAGLRAAAGDYFLVTSIGDSGGWQPVSMCPTAPAAAVHVVRPMSAGRPGKVFVNRGDELCGWDTADLVAEDPTG